MSEVIWTKLFSTPLFVLEGLAKAVVLLVDYTEISAIVTTSVVYLYELRKKFGVKSFLYFVFLNSQWLHILWITDEFVMRSFFAGTFTPLWLAWVAILIDYLEVPVIYDTLKRFFTSLKGKDLASAFAEIRKE